MDGSQKGKVRFSEGRQPPHSGAAEGAQDPGDLPFRSIAASAPTGIFLTDATGLCTYANDHLLAIAGISLEQALGRGWTRAIHPEDREAVTKDAADAPGRGAEFSREFRIVTPKAEVRWVHVRTKSLPSEGEGGPSRVGTVEDITERKVAEEALSKERATLADIVDLNPYSVAVYDGQGRYVRGNKAFSDLFRASPPADYSLFHDPVLERNGYSEAILRLKRGESVHLPGLWYNPREVRPDLPDNPVFVRGSAFPIMAEDEAIEHVVVIYEDVTERKRALDALRESEEHFRSLSVSAPVGVYRADTEGRIFYANPRLLEALGVNLQELQEKGWADLVHPDDKQRVVREVADAQAEGRELSVDLRVQARDGDVRWVHVQGRPVVSAEGGQIGRIGTVEDITERKVAEETLRESEERFRQIAENVGQGFFLSDASDNAAIYVSPAYDEIWGRPAQTAYDGPQSWLQAVHPEDRERVNVYIDKHARGRAEFSQEYRILRPDGSVRWVRDRVYPVKDGSGLVYRIVGVTEDITERKAAEDALRESELKYRLLIENANDAIVVAQDGVAKYFNRRAVDITGYSAEELSSRPFLEFIHEDDREMVLERHRKRLNGETVEPAYAARIVRKDGEIGWLEISGVLIDWEGKPASLNFVSDITERKRAEEALKESESRYRLLAENASDVICALDLDLRFTYVSPSITRMLGYTVDEAMAMSVDELLTSSSLESAMASLAEELESERTMGPDLDRIRTLELELKRKDGSTVWAELRATFVRDDEHRPIGVQAVVRDITARKTAEDELRGAKEIAEEAREVAEKRLAEAEESKRRLEIMLSDVVDREKMMVKLKREVNEHLRALGRQPKYKAPQTVDGIQAENDEAA